KVGSDAITAGKKVVSGDYGRDGAVGQAIDTAKKGVRIASDTKNLVAKRIADNAPKAQEALRQKALQAKKAVQDHVHNVKNNPNRGGLAMQAYDYATKDIPSVGKSFVQGAKNYKDIVLDPLRKK
ncbi:hypothetical protein EBU71_12105, partial [bacterium]|nr:hypothetical protein [Candidatus Elulimicrobium humile]